jgi:predicted flap endonuclease-1-like 5' DNA nuclease
MLVVARLPADPMLILALIVLVAVAALIGYAYGLRRRMPAIASDHVPSGVSVPAPAAADAVALPSTALGPDAERIGSEKARIIRSAEAEATRLRQSLADGDAIRYQAADFRDERARLFRTLADVRGDNARYRQLVIDIENNAPPPILSGAAGPDDLKLIVGIGPVLERMLHNLGIMTFQQIAHWSERNIADFDARLPEFPGRIRRDQWVTQARSLHQAKYGDGVVDLRPDARRP